MQIRGAKFRKKVNIDNSIQQLSDPERIKIKEHSLFARITIQRAVRKSWRHESYFYEGKKELYDSITGTPPSPSQTPLIFLACNDYYFQKFAKYMAVSAFKNDPDARIHVHVTNPEQKTIEEIQIISGLLDEISLSYTFDCSNIQNKCQYRSIFYTSLRYIILNYILKHSGGPVCCFDVDGIVRKPLTDHITAALGQADLALVKRRDQKKPSRQILAGASVFSTSAASLRFTDALSRALIRLMHEGPGYHLDQIVLHRLMLTAQKDGCVIGDLDPSFVDFKLQEGTHVWSAKGWLGKESERFQQALQDYESYYHRWLGL